MNTEPIALTTFIKEAISSGIKLLVVLGVVAFTGEQLAILLLFVDNFLALGAAVYSRSKSTPTATPSLPVGTPVLVATPAGAPADTPPPDAVVALRSELRGAQPE